MNNKQFNWQTTCRNATETATTGASALNAANGKTANAPKAASHCRTSCSATIASRFVGHIKPRTAVEWRLAGRKYHDVFDFPGTSIQVVLMTANKD